MEKWGGVATCLLTVIVFILFIPLQSFSADEEKNLTENKATLTYASLSSSESPAAESSEEVMASEDTERSNTLADASVKEKKDKSSEEAEAAATMSTMSTTSGGAGGGSDSLMGMSGVNIGEISNTGALNLSIPIVVPPGRKGIAPNLSISYNSNKGNGPLGVGFDIGLGAIQRSTKWGINWANDYYDTDDRTFVFVSGNGSTSELVRREDWGLDYYGSKIEEAFNKYHREPAGGWIVTTKNGTKYFYGTTTDSRQENDNGIFKWFLNKVQDTNGNYMTISYLPPDQGEIYIDEIQYTGHTVPSTDKFRYILL
ncbi:MAG: hypothetical protein JXA41_09525 [Deltaproteobacteria bacterium]|nr:hypothetical protein [Deltaproteobacteria bacterium]